MSTKEPFQGFENLYFKSFIRSNSLKPLGADPMQNVVEHLEEHPAKDILGLKGDFVIATTF